ncbi:hypothetical protein BDR06DRAFT_976275 [Suillus hirtellus]|nr:hypothetical protein BDR06DRAFT_976275 [Suillus hirtellus]
MVCTVEVILLNLCGSLSMTCSKIMVIMSSFILDEFKYKETYETRYWRSTSQVQVGRCIRDRSPEVNGLPYWSVWLLREQHHIVTINTYQCGLECYMYALVNPPVNKSSSLRGLLAFTASNVSHWNDGQGLDLIFAVSTHPYVPLAEPMDALIFVSYVMLDLKAHGEALAYGLNLVLNVLYLREGKLDPITSAILTKLSLDDDIILLIIDHNADPKQIGVVLEQLLPSFKVKSVKYVVKHQICRFPVIVALPGDSSQRPSRKRHACASYLPWASAAFVMRDISKPAEAQRSTLSRSYTIADLNVIPLDAWALGCKSGAAVSQLHTHWDLCDGEHCNVAKPKFMKRAKAMTLEIGHTGTWDSGFNDPVSILALPEQACLDHFGKVASSGSAVYCTGLQFDDQSLLVSTRACLTLLLYRRTTFFHTPKYLRCNLLDADDRHLEALLGFLESFESTQVFFVSIVKDGEMLGDFAPLFQSIQDSSCRSLQFSDWEASYHAYPPLILPDLAAVPTPFNRYAPLIPLHSLCVLAGPLWYLMSLLSKVRAPLHIQTLKLHLDEESLASAPNYLSAILDITQQFVAIDCLGLSFYHGSLISRSFDIPLDEY